MRCLSGPDRFLSLSEHLEASEKRLHTATVPWSVWLVHDFLRSCYVAGCLVWLGLGVVEVRYVLDPWYPGQGPPSAWVTALLVLFAIGSIAVQVLLYQRWWPSEPKERTQDTLDGFQAATLPKRNRL